MLYYNISPIRRTFPNVLYTLPNVLYTLYGKTFCLNCQAKYLKQPSTLELHFESKYFVISVAEGLNQNSFLNGLLMESSNCSYNHILLQWTISFWKKMFCYGVANHLYYLQQILHSKYFYLVVWLERCFCTDCLHSNYHELKWKVFFSLCPGLKTLSSVYILSVKLSAPQIFLFDGQAWKNSMEIIGYSNIYLLYEYHTVVYFLFHGLIWKSFAVFIKHFPVSQSGLKTWFQVNKNFQFFRCNYITRKIRLKMMWLTH